MGESQQLEKRIKDLTRIDFALKGGPITRPVPNVIILWASSIHSSFAVVG